MNRSRGEGIINAGSLLVFLVKDRLLFFFKMGIISNRILDCSDREESMFLLDLTLHTAEWAVYLCLDIVPEDRASWPTFALQRLGPCLLSS